MRSPNPIRESFMDSKKGSDKSWQDFEAMRAARDLTARENKWPRAEKVGAEQGDKKRQVNGQPHKNSSGEQRQKR
jgi:hypothetical protein